MRSTRPRLPGLIVLTSFLVAAFLTWSASAAVQSGVPTPVNLARTLQEKYEFVLDFSADFVHSYHGGVLRKEAVERGSVLIRKPGLMRWTYTSPEPKVFVSDGVKFYAYIPEDRQVMISTLAPGHEAATPALFLAGRGNITRDFVATFPAVADATPDSYTLVLTPRTRDGEYDSLTLVLAKGTLRILKLISLDAQGGQSTFTFSNLRENAGIPDKEFHFTIPRGVDVITDGQSKR